MGIKNVKLQNIYIDHHKYLGKRENSLKIYDRPATSMILSPFNMIFDPMNRILLVNFEKDSIYYSIELQIYHKLDKELPLVIMYRKDNMIDIYYTNEVVIKNKKDILIDLFEHVSFNQLEDIEFEFQFDTMGLHAYLFLKDKLEQEIEIKIKENSPGRELVSILAPMGGFNNRPKYFPIIFLSEFGMIFKNNTEIFVKIDGILKNAAEMPNQINGKKVYQAHYSLKPTICNWNKGFSGNIDPIILNTTSMNISEGNLTLALIRNSDYYEITKISGNDDKDHTVSFEFSPAIPNLISLRNNSKIKGRFSCIINEKKGIFGGIYYLIRTGETIEFSITPIKGWQPFSGKLWLKSYKWFAKIKSQENSNFIFTSYWRRNIE